MDEHHTRDRISYFNVLRCRRTPTYTKATKTKVEISPEITKFLKNRFNFEVTEINQKSSLIAATKCSVNPISKAVKIALKLMYNQIKHYEFKIRCYSDIEIFLTAHNNYTVIETTTNGIQRIEPFQFKRLISLFSVQKSQTKN